MILWFQTLCLRMDKDILTKKKVMKLTSKKEKIVTEKKEKKKKWK